MNEQHEASQAIPREHFFHVSIAKHLFYHPSYGIVTANEPIRLKDAAHYGLSPLILYGLSVPGTIVQWLNFARVEQPLPLLTVLGEAWLIADGLRGHPDILRVNKHLAQSSPDLAAQLARIGVELKVTEPGDRALSGGLRSVQHSTLWLLPGYEKRGPDIEDPLLVLRRVAFQRHLFSTKHPFYGTERKEIVQGTTEWLALPGRRVVSLSSVGGQDWIKGPWLTAWEKTLPPEKPRFFWTDAEERETRLLIGSSEEEDDADEDDEDDEVDVEDGLLSYFDDNTRELVSSLIDCWPCSPRDIAKFVGVTQRELHWYATDKADLDDVALIHVRGLFQLEVNTFAHTFIASGPYVLVARKADSIYFVYAELSQCDDTEPFELVPSSGEADPSWRYVLINRDDEPQAIVMVARGSELADQLGDLFSNYEGVKSVDRALYRDVVATCARAAASPEAYFAEMCLFQRRYRARGSS